MEALKKLGDLASGDEFYFVEDEYRRKYRVLDGCGFVSRTQTAYFAMEDYVLRVSGDGDDVMLVHHER